MPSTLETWFADRFLEQAIPIIDRNGNVLIITVYCINPENLYQDNWKPKINIDLRWYTKGENGQLNPSKKGLMIPLDAVEEIFDRIDYYKDKYSRIKTFADLKRMFGKDK